MSGVNLKSTADRIDFRHVSDTEGLIIAVTVVVPPFLYLPMECNVCAISTTNEVCTITHGNITNLNIQCKHDGHCNERARIS